MTTPEPMEALEPERIELPGGYYFEPHLDQAALYEPSGNINFGLWPLEDALAFAAAMNARPATDGLRNALTAIILKASSYYANVADDECSPRGINAALSVIIETARTALDNDNAATPQAPAAPPVQSVQPTIQNLYSQPPVLPSDEEMALSAIRAAMGREADIPEHYLNLAKQLAPYFTAHRTAHQNAAAPHPRALPEVEEALARLLDSPNRLEAIAVRDYINTLQSKDGICPAVAREVDGIKALVGRIEATADFAMQQVVPAFRTSVGWMKMLAAIYQGRGDAAQLQVLKADIERFEALLKG
jgi:hypothetical protein